MPSADLKSLVQNIQDVTREKFELAESYSQHENDLVLKENELRLLAK